MEHVLRYDRPAAYWEEALPIGNGRLGAMLYGGVDTERIQLNEDTLWSGGVPSDEKVNDPSDLARARELIFAGQYREANDLVNARLLGPWTESYLCLGDLYLRFTGSGTLRGYRRALHLNEGRFEVSYEQDIASFRQQFTGMRREAFAAADPSVIALRLLADDAGEIGFTAFLHSGLSHGISLREGALFVSGHCPSHVEPSYIRSDDPVQYDGGVRTIRFAAGVCIELSGGRLIPHGTHLEVVGAREAVLYLAAATDFAGFDRPPDAKKDLFAACLHQLDRARAMGYEALRARHTATHRAVFDRAEVKMGDGADKTVEEMLSAYRAGRDQGALAALMFQYGRYLLMGSSAPGTQPANLQGIWNHHIRPVWSCNLTTNINAQMNYWHAETANLAEYAKPLFAAIREMAVTGADTARRYFGARGFAVAHNVDIWRKTSPAGGHAVHSYWPMAAGWLCRHLYEQYRFSGDIAFLRDEALPLMLGAASFLLDWLIPHGDYLVTCPSVSPENHFRYGDGKVASTGMASTMDIAIIRELFENCLAAARAVRAQDPLLVEIEKALPKLPPYRVGKNGGLMEWFLDFDEAEPGHRHVSHLYGLYPGEQLLPGRDDALRQAAAETLRLRLESGGGHTGWSCAWILCLYARLLDGEGFARFFDMLIEHSTYANLFDKHPPFQIDGNMGFSAAFAEMLVQSHEQGIRLLPALPRAWARGRARGLRARGGFEVSLAWEAGTLAAAELRSGLGGPCQIISPTPLSVFCGEASVPASHLAGVLRFETEPGRIYRVMP